MRYNLSLNFNLLETNLVNLFVVVTIVITVVSENLNSALDQRRQKILIILQRIDKEIAISRENLIAAERLLEQANLLCTKIETQSTQILNNENEIIQKQLQEEIGELLKTSQQRRQFESRTKVKSVSQQILRQRLVRVKTTLQGIFPHTDQPSTSSNNNQIALNYKLIDRELCNIMKVKHT